MTVPASFSQPKPPIRVVAVDAVFTLDLGANDPDFIVLEASSSAFSGSVINLPSNAAQGKVFTFVLYSHPVVNPSLTSPIIDIFFPRTRGTGVISFWRMYPGQRPAFVFGPNGWICGEGTATSSVGAQTDGAIAIGSHSIGGIGGTALGYKANGSQNGVAVGNSAVGSGNGVAVGYNANGGTTGNTVAVGFNTISGVLGTAIGAYSNSSTRGSSLGYNANSNSFGAAVGFGSNGNTNGTALGYQASSNTKDAAVVLGYNSTAQRYREFVKSADGAATTLQNYAVVNWYGDTTNATATELFLGGTASQRCILLANSAFQFEMQICAAVTAAGNTSSWTVSGCIKMGATAATAVLVGSPTVTMTGQDAGAAAWAVSVTADATNGALKLTVTGAAATTIRWNAHATLSELRF